VSRPRHAKATKQLQMLFMLLLFVSCSWLVFSVHTHAANSSSAFPQRLQHLQAIFKGRVQSPYGVSGGYWELSVNYSMSTVPLLARTRFRVTNKSCWQLASAHPESHSPLSHPTRQPPTVSKPPQHKVVSIFAKWSCEGQCDCRHQQGDTAVLNVPIPGTFLAQQCCPTSVVAQQCYCTLKGTSQQDPHT
jgi:hypothetical protein